MSLHSWLQKIRSALAPNRGQRRRQDSTRAVTRRPGLEVLEDRLTPSFAWDGAYHSEPPPGVIWTPSLPLLADFTSDGIPDQLSVNFTFYELAIRPGRGDGTFGDPITSGIYAPNGGGLAVADFNGDGRLDVFVASDADWQGLHWGETLLGRGDGSFDSGGIYSLDDFAAPFQIAMGCGTKVNLDTGRTDVVIGNWIDDYVPVYVVLVNNGDWEPPPPPPPTEPSLSIDDLTVTEGNSGAASATFTVTLSAASSETITVDYATGNATATAGTDYQAASGTITFAPGETSKTITVRVIGDRLPEPNETFVVNLSGATNATISDGQGDGTITDDEPRISVTDVTKREGSKHTTSFVFTITLSAAYDEPVTMSFQTVNGTATTGDNDYVAKSGTITFNPGATSKTITIAVRGDRKKEANEVFYVDLFGNSSNSLFTKNRGIGTILNED